MNFPFPVFHETEIRLLLSWITLNPNLVLSTGDHQPGINFCQLGVSWMLTLTVDGFWYAAISSWMFMDHQKFQVPKMEGFLNLISGHFGVGFYLTWALHTAYIGEDSSILGTWNVGWMDAFTKHYSQCIWRGDHVLSLLLKTTVDNQQGWRNCQQKLGMSQNEASPESTTKCWLLISYWDTLVNIYICNMYSIYTLSNPGPPLSSALQQSTKLAVVFLHLKTIIKSDCAAWSRNYKLIWKQSLWSAHEVMYQIIYICRYKTTFVMFNVFQQKL